MPTQRRICLLVEVYAGNSQEMMFLVDLDKSSLIHGHDVEYMRIVNRAVSICEVIRSRSFRNQ